MINFILYEEKTEWQEYYKKVINHIFLTRKEKYKILVFSNYSNEVKEKIHTLIGKNIYLLSMDALPLTGLDLAKKIRQKGDWKSPIILTTIEEEKRKKGFTSKVLAIDVLRKEKNMKTALKKALLIALQIQDRYKSFNFMYNHILYQIPYHDILYFEKDLNHNYTSIITKTHIYKIKESITKIENQVSNSPYFFKTHQSCIVNLRNIKKVDFQKHIIYFKNQEIDLLSRNKKKALKELLTTTID